MEYLVKSGSPEKQRVGCVIVGIFDRRKPSTQAEALDVASGGLIASVMRRGDMDGKLGQTTLLHGLDDLFCDRILLVGLRQGTRLQYARVSEGLCGRCRRARRHGRRRCSVLSHRTQRARA